MDSDSISSGADITVKKATNSQQKKNIHQQKLHELF
jgi:hypothetical protein